MRLRDPKQREEFKTDTMAAIRGLSADAAARLHISPKQLEELVELQADEEVALRAESAAPVADGAQQAFAQNPRIAEEFGPGVASRWSDYLKNTSGRLALEAGRRRT